MSSICQEAEASPDYGRGPEILFLEDRARFASATAQACVDAAENLDLAAIVAFTEIRQHRPVDLEVSPSYRHLRLHTTRGHLSEDGAVLRSDRPPLWCSRFDGSDDRLRREESLGGRHRQARRWCRPCRRNTPQQAATTNLMKLHSIGSGN